MASIPDMEVAIQVHTDPLSKARAALTKLETRMREVREATLEYETEMKQLEEGMRELRRRQHETEDKK
jgi:predicted  nucleic acid-binding Zn-ribbon protein